MENNTTLKQLSICSLLALHLLPGGIILLLATIFANPVWGLGLPIFLSLMMAILFGLIPSELGIIILVSKQTGQRVSDVLGFKEKMTRSQTILWVTPLFILAASAFSIVSSIEHPLWTAFNWLPEWFRLDTFSFDNYSNSMVFYMMILGFILNGFLGPLVEELYFRGFLLPRMNVFGKLAPLVNAILFSLYHFFTPWENITRILGVTPFVYAVWYKKNIRIGILVHCLLNTASLVIQLIAFLG